MSQSVDLEVKVALLIQVQAAQQREIEENKREADAEIKRVKDEAEAEIQQVREKAESDSKANTAKIAVLEEERNKALKWGVMTLGTAVIAMAMWIFDKVIGGHIK